MSGYRQSDQMLSPDGYTSLAKDPQWQEYRSSLEKAALTSDILHLTISSSATLNKGEIILINALGLVSHASKRTNPSLHSKHSKDPNMQADMQNDPENDIQGTDMRDGFVFFGCKKSLKQHQNSLDNESTTLVSHIHTEHIWFQKRVVNDFVIPNKNEQTAE